MNIFANLKLYESKRKREVILLFPGDFCDFQLIREYIKDFDYDKQEITFILNTGILDENQEASLNSFLLKELGSKYSSIDYKRPERYVENGHPRVHSYHQHLECTIFTSDNSEKDVECIIQAAKKIVGWYQILRRPTEKEIINRYHQEILGRIIEIIEIIGKIVLFILVVGLIILGCVFISDHKEIQAAIAYSMIIGIVLFLFFIVLSFVSESTDNKVFSVFKSIIITLGILGLMILLGYWMPDSCSGYINDAHRP